MKHFKKTVFLMILVTLFQSCQEDQLVKETTTDVESSNLIEFKGIPVDHRFGTPEAFLNEEHGLESIKATYREIKQEALSKGYQSRSESEGLPDVAIIYEAAKNVLHLFPYDPIDDEEELGQLDVKTLVGSTHYQSNQEKYDMIKRDFPTLKDAEFESNMDVIEAYYSQNFEYVVLEEIAKNGEALANRIANESTNSSNSSNNDSCLENILELMAQNFPNPLHLLKVAIAHFRVGNKPENWAESYYGQTNGGNNTRGDAFRHAAWNALLADKYITISSKRPRLDFAKAYTDTYESCTGGDLDSKTMDYHNNAIGRDIWNDNTSYIRFLGITIGLNTPSNRQIKSLVTHAVNKESCFILKFKTTAFPNNLLSQSKTIAQVVTKINNTDQNTLVYFNGTIAPADLRYEEVFSHYEQVECQLFEDHDTIVGLDGQCLRPVFVLQQVSIPACYDI